MEDFPSDLNTIYNDMEITNVVVRRGSKSPKSLAFCDVTFNECLKVNNIELIETNKGTKEILMPYRRDKMKPRFRLDYVHPVNKELHKVLRSVIINCYEKHEETNESAFGYKY